MNNIIIAWLKETIQRLVKKSPVYFRILQGVAVLAIIITQLPGTLTQLGIEVPVQFEHALVVSVRLAGIVAIVIGQLTVKDNSELPLTK